MGLLLCHSDSCAMSHPCSCPELVRSSLYLFYVGMTRNVENSKDYFKKRWKRDPMKRLTEQNWRKFPLFFLDMKPSSALTLQLLEYEKRIRGGGDPSSTKTKFKIRKILRLASQNWIPMTIYFLVVLILAKFIYETIVHMIQNDKDNDSEMVCV